MKGPVLFSNPEFNCLANNSAFQVEYRGIRFQTAEHAYQYSRFYNDNWEFGKTDKVGALLLNSVSVNVAMSIAFVHQDSTLPGMKGYTNQAYRTMLSILKCKSEQHSDVRNILPKTRPRLLINDIPHLIKDDDEIWGQGEYGNGKNMLGQVWMDIRV